MRRELAGFSRSRRWGQSRRSPSEAFGFPPKRKRAKLRFESLEERALLAVAALPTPFDSLLPDGSLVYRSSADAEVDSTGDMDSFTLNLDDGQTVSVVVTTDDALQASVELLDPSSISISSASAAAAGETVVLNAVATTAPGVYRLNVDGVSETTGGYSVEFILNAAMEDEEHGGPVNNELATAQDLDPSFISLGFGSAERGAVLGSVSGLMVAPIQELNGARSESDPWMSTDGLTLLYQAGGGDILMATRATTTDPFKSSIVLGDGVNTADREVTPFLSADGLTLLFGSDRPGGVGSLDLYMASRASTDEEFSSVTNLGTGVNSDLQERDPALSADGLTLLFTSDRDRTVGGQDIYMATRASTDELFGNVERLGPAINSSETERGPILSADGLRLLFQSSRPGSVGRNDIWEAVRFSARDSFIQSARLSTAINTDANEGGPSFGLDDTVIAFHSVRLSGQGGSDLYQATQTADWYRFTLEDGQSATVSAVMESGDNLAVNLYDADAARLAMGIATKNLDAVISNFVDPTSDGMATPYFVEVTGQSVDYNLVVSRDAQFDTEPNDDRIAGIQDISSSTNVLGSVMSQGSAGSVDASGPIVNFPIDLFDGDGFKWDILSDGQIHNGTNNAYDGGSRHDGFPGLNDGLAEMNGREIAIGPRMVGDVEVTRKVYVPEDQGFARYLEIITNSSSSPVQHTLVLSHHLGGGSSNFLIGSAVDNDVFDKQDNWLVTQAGFADIPAMLHVVAGERGLRPSAAEIIDRDFISFQYDLELAPGETQIVMHFASQNVDRPTALMKGPLLADLQLDALAGVSPEEANQIVNFQFDDVDVYGVEARQGDDLSIRTKVPASGPGQFNNVLDPAVELYDPEGMLIARKADGALNHTALLDGTYAVRMIADNDTSGEYVLEVTGHSGGLPPYSATARRPRDGQALASPPTEIVLDLSGQVLLSSVESSDLTIDGQPATGVSIRPKGRLVFGLPPLAEGFHTVAVAAGAWEDLQGQPLEAFRSTFSVDMSGPRVISLSVQEGGAISAGEPVALTIGFDERLEGTSLDPSDFELRGSLTGTVKPRAFDYQAAPSELTLMFDSLVEDQYVLILDSGDGEFEDVLGNDMDGEPSAFPIPPNVSGDGVPGGDFKLGFTADIMSIPYPTELTAKPPSGSLIYDPTADGTISVAGDVDRFTIDVDEGQSITAVVQSSQSLRPTVELTDPENVQLVSASAASPAEDTVLQTINISRTGTYTIAVSGQDDTTGSYTVSLVLNAAVEDEDYDGPENDSLATAQDIDPSFISLGFGSAERGAVLGSLARLEVEPLVGVNSPAPEQNPSMTADGLTLVFNSNRPAGAGKNDLYIATRATTGEPFGSAVPLGGDINTPSAEATPFISPDGLTLLFHSNRSSGFGGRDLYMATRASTDEPFGNVVNLGAGVNSDAAETHAALSADGLTLLFSSSRPGSRGRNDIYMATRASTDELFGNVERLGPGVNTFGDDKAPALSSDGLRLLFQSDRIGSIGGTDIYEATRNTTLESFAESKNLAPRINTTSLERGPEFAIDDTVILFDSDREGGLGASDLYQLDMATSPEDWYQFTLDDGQSATVGFTITRAGPRETETVAFQNGVDGYNAAVDTFVAEASPDADNSDVESLKVDADFPHDSGQAVEALVRFQDIFGEAPDKVHATDQIVSARLELNITGSGDPMELHRMVQDWDDQATWNSFGGNGVQVDGTEAVASTDVVTDAPEVGTLVIDVTSSVRAWQEDPSTNRGWVLIPTGNDGIDFHSAEQGSGPRLVVERRLPLPNMALQVTDDKGKVLAEGEPIADNVDLMIRDFVDTTTDGEPEPYFVRIAANESEYTLVVTRDTDFDIEDNDGPNGRAQDISDAQTVLGAVEATSLTFAVIGDWGVPQSEADYVANMIKNTGWDVDFITTVGDNNYGGLATGDSDWEELLGRRYGDFMLGRTDNRYPLQTSSVQRFFPAVGNHDSSGDGGRIASYLDYFHADPSRPGRLPAGVHTNDVSYYDVEVPIENGGSVRLFVVDSDHARVDSTLRADQQQWLEEGLSNSIATWNFVLFHHAPYSSSEIHGTSAFMQWDFAEWGADAVFSGHAHTYERIIHPDDGLLYFVTGLGGQVQYGFDDPIPGSQLRYNAAHGAMRVTVDSQSATFEFHSIDDGASGELGGALIDSYTLTKQGTRNSDDDYYNVDVATGDVLTAAVQIPASGPGQFSNELDIGLGIYDPSSVEVASGSAELLWHTATETGSHSVRVLPENGTSGEYVLHVNVGPLGDINLDGQLDMDDTDALILGLWTPATYEKTHGLPPTVRGDTDGDGDLDFDDIDEFVTLLTRGPEALFSAAAASVDRALSESSSESFLAPNWPVIGQEMNVPSQRTGQAEGAEASALGDTIRFVPPPLRRLETPRELTPGRSLDRDAAGQSTAIARSMRGSASEEYEDAVWAEDGDWLLDVAEREG